MTRHLSDFVALGTEAVVEFFAAAREVVFRDSRLAEVERLSEPAQHVYLAYVLDAEVLDGGLSQFFSNTSGNRVSETLEALRQLDASGYLAVLTDALTAFAGDIPSRDQVVRHRDLEVFEAAHPDYLNDLDDRWYALSRRESIENIMLRYLERHATARLESNPAPTP